MEKQPLVSLPGGKSPIEAESRAYWGIQASLMRDLMAYPGWEAFTAQLGGLEHNWVETMISASDPQAYAYAQGFIKGLRTAHNLPQAIITKTEQAAK